MSGEHATLARPTGSLPAILPLGDQPLSIEALVALATGQAKPCISGPARRRMAASHEIVRRRLDNGETIYGVTTGVGHSVDTAVAAHRSAELSLNLLRMHGCGTGAFLSDETSAAVLAVRLCSLVRGASGVRPAVADRLVDMLSHRVLPVVPCEGSVGASGDLTPLSYVAAVLVGEREVSYGGRVMSAAEALRTIGATPLVLGPKETLALMNGTSVASAIGILAWWRARRVARLAATITAMASEGVRGNPEHFDARIHRLKPHAGQQAVAAWVREDMGERFETHDPPTRLQDRYSIRCVPHVVGVLFDALEWSRKVLETEINGVSDNPVVDIGDEEILHGGNFYGGHVGFVMDSLKAAVASVSDLLDRQLTLMCSPAENGGLPANLVGVDDEASPTHHGFKAMGITASALAAEALKLTMPAASFSRSTELHNQDKVPMATIASRDLTRIVELTEQVCAISLLGCCQAIDLRGGPVDPDSRVAAMFEAVREVAPRLSADRRMDVDILAILERLRSDGLPLGDLEAP